MISIDVQPREVLAKVHDLVRMALPGYRLEESLETGDEGHIFMECLEQGKRVKFIGSITMRGNPRVTSWEEEYLIDSSETGQKGQFKLAARTFIYQLLCLHLERKFNPYGILTGVRPVKLVHQLMDQKLTEEQVLGQLTGKYHIDFDKARLLMAVAQTNRPLFPEPCQSSCRRASLYIGIPFCPSRCSYCSFPGAAIGDYPQEVGVFMDALLMEMEAVGKCVQEKNWLIDTIYVGGGTPTILTEQHWERIFSVLRQKYISSATREITVEAGRPDTLNLRLLTFLQQAGIDRICVNPQSMQDQTLARIGRRHDRKMVADAVRWARQAGIRHINMDIIVGLPGEGPADFLNTAQQVLELEPDNITVHTLAVKKGSALSAAEGRVIDPQESKVAEQGINDLRQMFEAEGYRPYYLYRQKFMRANLENIGYCLDQSACLYNVMMMEERQTIIGLGGGAGSKFFARGPRSLGNIHNPKDPQSYVRALPRLIALKVDKL
ncbi:MAG: coproporphyrinogen dehydrogenase HemZ [Syntrophomonadaceae bacterium]